MSETIIDIKGLNVSYEKKNVLNNVYAHIDKGYSYGVIGPNGAGKSTFFKAILGLVEYTQGNITVFGENVEKVRKSWLTFLKRQF